MKRYTAAELKAMGLTPRQVEHVLRTQDASAPAPDAAKKTGAELGEEMLVMAAFIPVAPRRG